MSFDPGCSVPFVLLRVPFVSARFVRSYVLQDWVYKAVHMGMMIWQTIAPFLRSFCARTHSSNTSISCPHKFSDGLLILPLLIFPLKHILYLEQSVIPADVVPLTDEHRKQISASAPLLAEHGRAITRKFYSVRPAFSSLTLFHSPLLLSHSLIVPILLLTEKIRSRP